MEDLLPITNTLTGKHFLDKSSSSGAALLNRGTLPRNTTISLSCLN